jgi:hypothetical protein
MVRVVIGKVVGDNGKSIEYAWDNDNYKLGVRLEGSTEPFTYGPSLRGLQGIQGEPGKDGFTPQISMSGTEISIVTKNTDGETVTIVQNLIGPQGIQGVQGEKGDPATGVAIGSFYWFYVDDNGDLWLEGEDVDSQNFTYDSETGNLYKNYGEANQLLLGNVKGPKGDVGPSQDLTNYVSKTELASELQQLKDDISAINTEETKQNNLLGTS